MPVQLPLPARRGADLMSIFIVCDGQTERKEERKEIHDFNPKTVKARALCVCVCVCYTCVCVCVRCLKVPEQSEFAMQICKMELHQY